MRTDLSLFVDIYESAVTGRVYHGSIDVSLSVLEHMLDGLPFGEGDRLPATFSVCKLLSHDARMAIWNERLFSEGLQATCAQYRRRVMEKGGAELVLDTLQLSDGAMEMMEYAEKLLEDVKDAKAIYGDWGVHPISNKIMLASLIHSEIPFCFGTTEVKFSGVRIQSLIDFIDAGGETAEDFLGTIIASPLKWFKDVPILDKIMQAYGDRRISPKNDLFKWNAKQDITLRQPDKSIIVIPKGGSKDEAIAWCEGNYYVTRQVSSALTDKGSKLLKPY